MISFKGVCAFLNFDISKQMLDEDTDLQPTSTALSTLLISLNDYAT
ncbi:Bgt-388 [Blumeria graminis f. sp. tritici]|uniref:Bgt-388 n=2 Tax=Blumeria graminis f. sp. tritici TaxID=62690 RepID=A0A9X9MG27_BLUGR|nr:hypothetical protein BGT96224_388 [Blumeria graminis f. sp. tritici 96224]VDB85815.1 Bgt-388 [Blumeria graminis f. sp. tritici]